MKFISTLFIALGLITSTSLHANDSIVSVTVNKQTYQFDRPIRLSSVLSIVADSGDWYWPSASAFDLTNPTAESRWWESVIKTLGSACPSTWPSS